MTEKELHNRRQKQRMRAIILSFVISASLMGLKFLTYRLTHSSAVLSDALESIINVAASGFAIVSVWLAAKPPDPEHPYGHGKIEYFSAGFEGALIIFAAAGIFWTGIKHLIKPHALPNIEQGLAILCIASVANLLLGLYLLRVGRRTESVTLIADGKHIITDVYTSAGVLIGLALVYITGWLWIDGLVACLVGINILVTGSRLVRQSFSRLMDASDVRLLDRIARHLEKHRKPEWIDIHKLRAWRAGNLIHVDLHLVLPKDLPMDAAHHEARAIEELLADEFDGNASALVHMDPCDPRYCPICAQQTCQWRSQTVDRTVHWNGGHLARSRSDRSNPDD
ncbi:MAG: cation diffusion facilitator family transporter [Desulfobacteraceae bacterium]|jgi:cation diffusion facilitator family transporter